MNKLETMTRDEFDKWLEDWSQKSRDFLWEMLHKNPITNTSLDIVDYSAECSMCGKPMPYRHSGMCSHCEMVWNS